MSTRTIAYDCMTAEELELWRRPSVRQGGRTPCVDCPLWFAREQRAAGCCNGTPGALGRPRLSPDVPLHGRGNPYASEEERTAARRKSWRLSKQRQVPA